MKTVLAVVLLFGLSLLANADDRTCYHLDGSEAPDQRPCTSNGVTNCCGTNDLCLTNGLCMFQGSSGLILSRGSCTDKGWASDCYAPCSKYERHTGMALINLGYNFSHTRYCCNNVIADNGSVACRYEEPFELTQGTVIPDAGFLKHNGGSNSSSPSSPGSIRSSASCVAVEAGLSVPLGLIAIAAVAWAFWERRKQRKNAGQFPLGSLETGVTPPTSRQRRTAELHTSRIKKTIPELMDTGREYKEAPGDSRR